MQSRNGGCGSFDADNTHHYLNNIPFADHGALLDPPTADLTARCVSMLTQLGYPREPPAMAGAIAFLRREQKEDGSRFGRWGTNYVYGTWSVLRALNVAGEDMGALRPQGGRLAEVAPAGGWRLGRELRQLLAQAQGREGREHLVPDRLGAARADGRGQTESDAVARWHRVSQARAARRGDVARDAVQRRGLPVRLLSALPRLQRLFPPLGARPGSGRRCCEAAGWRAGVGTMRGRLIRQPVGPPVRAAYFQPSLLVAMPGGATRNRRPRPREVDAPAKVRQCQASA
jgi:squalene cyclase